MTSPLVRRHRCTALLLTGDAWDDALTATLHDDTGAARRVLAGQRRRRAALAACRGDLSPTGPLDDLRLLRDLVRVDDDLVALARGVLEHRAGPDPRGRPVVRRLRVAGPAGLRVLAGVGGPGGAGGLEGAGTALAELVELRDELLALAGPSGPWREDWQGLALDLADAALDVLRHAHAA